MTIKMSKFAKVLERSSSVEDIRHGRVFASPQINFPPADSNCSLEIAVSTNSNSLKPTSVIFALTSILLVLCACSNPKILAPIIKRVMVPMVCVASIAIIEAQNHAVHSQKDLLAVRAWSVAQSVKTFCSLVPAGVPLPLVEPFKISRINNGYLPLCKRYFLVRWDSGHPQNSILGGLGRMVAHPMPHYNLCGVSS